MIVAVSGVSGTGKTSLMQELQKYSDSIKSLGYRVEFHPELIRQYTVNKGLLSLTDIMSDTESAYKLQSEVIDYAIDKYQEMQRNSVGNNIIYIVDRSPLDSLVYLILNYSRCSEDVIGRYKYHFEEYSTKAKVCYDLVIDRVYLSLPEYSTRFQIDDDGYRPIEYSTRRSLEIELFNILFTDTKVLRLPSTTSDRIRVIYKDLVNLITK